MQMKILAIIFNLLIVLSATAGRPMPVTGSWFNLFYQDVRNKYTNPEFIDNTEPELWRSKVDMLHRMGMEYIVLMAVANEGKAAYPSKIMPWAYLGNRESPVDAILDQAQKNKMKVFLSIGWANNQDDNLKDKTVFDRQMEIMDELAALYGKHSAMYGWYLPVEDCLGPVLAESSVKSVNKLVARAAKITPGKKTMISPYGFFCSDFDNPKFGERIDSLKVDIIAYQDEIGCVREEFPLPRLRENWKKVKAIHDRNNIELWANCELFTWENETNSRTSALVPASQARIVAQLQAASDAGVERIISFMVPGIMDDGGDNFALGQPGVSAIAAKEYDSWRGGNEKYLLLEKTMSSEIESSTFHEGPLFDGLFGEEDPNDRAWVKIKPGKTDFKIKTGNNTRIFLRFLDCHKRKIALPFQIAVYIPDADNNLRMVALAHPEHFPNDRHDTWIEGVPLTIPKSDQAVISIITDGTAMIDEISMQP